MRHFSFSLEPLLKFRCQKVKKLQGELAILNQEKTNDWQKKNQLRVEKKRLEQSMIKLRLEGDMSRQEEIIAYVAYLDKELSFLDTQMKMTENKFIDACQAVEIALKERKIIEKLKERQYCTWSQKHTRSQL